MGQEAAPASGVIHAALLSCCQVQPEAISTVGPSVGMLALLCFRSPEEGVPSKRFLRVPCLTLRLLSWGHCSQLGSAFRGPPAFLQLQLRLSGLPPCPGGTPPLQVPEEQGQGGRLL